MSTENPNWTWLIQFCLDHKYRFCPGKGGSEPWVSLECVAHLVQQETAYVSRKFKGLARHPCFNLVRMTDLESVCNGEET